MPNERLQPRLPVIGAGLMLLLAACGPAANERAARQAAPAAQATPAAVPGTPAPSLPEASRTAAEQAAAPDDTSAEAAETTVRRYYGAINARDYATAYALWSNAGAASRQTAEAFAHGYAKTSKVDVRIGKAFDAQGAAGSRYITVPVELAAAQADGSTRHYRGSFTLRAVMADGATPDQRRWHLDSADLEGYEPGAAGAPQPQ